MPSSQLPGFGAVWWLHHPSPFCYTGSDFINAVVYVLSTGFFPVSWVVFIVTSNTGWLRESFHLKYQTVPFLVAMLVLFVSALARSKALASKFCFVRSFCSSVSNPKQVEAGYYASCFDVWAFGICRPPVEHRVLLLWVSAYHFPRIVWYSWI